MAVAIWRIPAVLVYLLVQMAGGLEFNPDSTDSIKSTAKTIAYDMVSFYTRREDGIISKGIFSNIPGLLPFPNPPDGYYWWEAGAMFGALIDYWYYTGDTTYNNITTEAMLHQVGEDIDFAPRNQTASLGNDDQAFWGMTAMAAAEYNFPNPPAGGPSWLGLVQAVYNEQVGRWDTKLCNGGLRWQVPPQNRGYNLKNTISNGALFNLAARLARYTKDPSYAEWGVKIWDWMWAIGLISPDYKVFDNAEAEKLNCTELDRNQWSYNTGTMIMGASTMYNFTGDPLWLNRTEGLLKMAFHNFFPGGVMKEGCEEAPKGCNVDQQSFKAYLSRWLTVTSQMAPVFAPNITALLKSSAKAAAAQCNGGPGGTACGLKWDLNGTWDESQGVGQSMAALEVVLGTMVGLKEAGIKPPVTIDTGGTSLSIPTAGKNASAIPEGSIVPLATKQGKAGAWLLTVFIVLITMFMIFFMWSEAWENSPSTVRGVAAKGKRTMNEKLPQVERTILNLNTGKRRSVGCVISPAPVAVAANRSATVLPKMAEGEEDIVDQSTKQRQSIPIYRGGEQVT